jgi:hypothetical protein
MHPPCVPRTDLISAGTLELKSLLAGHVARAAAVFSVDEIVVYDQAPPAWFNRAEPPREEKASGRPKAFTDSSGFLVSLLSYLECPPHLRRRLFPLHPDLRCAGLVPSLDLPHHARQREWCQYREGVSVGPAADAPGGKKQRRTVFDDDAGEEGREAAKAEAPTLVDVGFPVVVPDEIAPNSRVTVKFDGADAPRGFPYIVEGEFEEVTPLAATPVDPAAPREEGGYYWGYSVRRAASLSAVFTECPFESGYDVSVGTSERGDSVWDVLVAKRGSAKGLPETAARVVVVFGGLAGLEAAAHGDPELAERGIGRSNIRDMFDYYVDICPGQGSRTIRTEEAVLITLGQLRGWLMKALE